MSNMSYCRFRNTLADLEDCQDHFNRTESTEEAQAAIDLYRLCVTITNTFDMAMLERKLNKLEQAENEGDDE